MDVLEPITQNKCLTSIDQLGKCFSQEKFTQNDDVHISTIDMNLWWAETKWIHTEMYADQEADVIEQLSGRQTQLPDTNITKPRIL